VALLTANLAGHAAISGFVRVLRDLAHERSLSPGAWFIPHQLAEGGLPKTPRGPRQAAGRGSEQGRQGQVG
jgi:hypothetical protein